MRFRFLSLPLFLFLGQACFSVDGCDLDFTECDTDDDCAADQFGDPAAFFGPSCVPATLCKSDADCGFGFHCRLRADLPPTQPFDAPTPRDGVCDCSPDCPAVGSGGGATTTTTATTTLATGGGGAGGAGQGGVLQGGGGQGGTGQGGTGGNGGAQ